MAFVKAPACQREGTAAVTVLSEMIAKPPIVQSVVPSAAILEWGIWGSLAHEGSSSMG